MKNRVINVQLIFGFILMTNYSFSQDSTKTSKFSIGFNYAYEISYRSISPNEEGEKYPIVENFSIPLLDSLQSSINAYTLGIGLNYQMKKWFAIESGVYYSLKGHKADEVWFTNDGGTSIDTGKITTNYNFIDIPLGININFRANKLRFFIALGGSMNLFIANNTKAIGNKITTENKYDSYPLINFSVNVGAGIDYDFHQKWYLRINPRYQRFLSNIDRNFKYNYLNWNPYCYGVNVGVYYKF